jgi:polynucleotide 5'-kinase involved in rRNA processing
MSWVSNCVLSFSATERATERLEEVNRFFKEPEKGFVSVDDVRLPKGWYGGGKSLETPLYVGAFDFLPEQKFIAYLADGVKWQVPESVQLIIKRENDDVFEVICPHRFLDPTGVSVYHKADSAS